jgi:hypothetical protein
LVEQAYEINNYTYKPDLTVFTETGERIFFEVDHTNKKKPEDYMSVWIDLNSIVVEVNTKDLININSKSLPIFKALFNNARKFEIRSITPALAIHTGPEAFGVVVRKLN